ncbi:hypothetical protein X769_13120 [Mesorhizobium sp. LSJC268A00]|nr:hypothetical protein X769_13120 [Mesorhizobium sp. LSJC268A00]
MRHVHHRRPLLRPRLELPEPGGQRAELVDHFARPFGVVDGRDDLAAVADDAGIGDQALDILVGEGSDLVEVETGEGLAEILALAQNGQPGQAGLKAFEADLFEQPAVVGDRPAPFMVVVVQIVRQIAVPEAARDPVGAGKQSGVVLRHGQSIR